MAVFKRLSKAEIENNFTHYGSLNGVPIYYNETNNGVAVRNWFPEWLLDAANSMQDVFNMVMAIEDASFAIKIEGKIKHFHGDKGC